VTRSASCMHSGIGPAQHDGAEALSSQAPPSPLGASPSSLATSPVPRPAPQGTPAALPSPSLHCLSRLRSTALCPAVSRSGGLPRRPGPQPSQTEACGQDHGAKGRFALLAIYDTPATCPANNLRLREAKIMGLSWGFPRDFLRRAVAPLACPSRMPGWARTPAMLCLPHSAPTDEALYNLGSEPDPGMADLSACLGHAALSHRMPWR